MRITSRTEGTTLSIQDLNPESEIEQPSTVVVDDFVYAVAELPASVMRLLREVDRLERDIRRQQRRARQLQDSYQQCQARLRQQLAKTGVRPIRVVGY